MTNNVDWDDFRLFQAIAEHGTARATAIELGISHSTLSRRLEHLEATLSVLLFERSQRGFKLTEAGVILLESTSTAAAELMNGQRKVAGLDQSMAGPIRVTMPDILAFEILMPAFGEFQDRYPDIDLEIDISYSSMDLERREADIAVRMLHLDELPPEQLVGRKIAQSYASAYATPAYVSAHKPGTKGSTARWLGWHAETDQDWIARTPYAHLASRGVFNHAELQNRAARAGLGIAYIPCALGASDDGLMPLPRMKPTPARDIWLLTHRDLRDATRMKALRALIAETIVRAVPLLSGKRKHA